VTEATAPSRAAPAPAAWRTLPRRHPLAWFVVKRVLAGLLTLLAVSVLVFAATELLSGDPAGAILGRNATPENLAEVRAAMGLDEPAIERYLDWLGGLLSGDLGNTAAGYAQGSEIPVWDSIEDKLVNSFALAALTTALMVPLSLLLGVWAARRAGRVTDHAISVGSLVLVSLPEFVLGSLLILLFFYQLELLPPVALIAPGESVFAEPKELILPVLTLLGVTLAGAIRMVRAGVIETLGSDYVQTARLNGFRERRVVWRYAVRNALGPAVQIWAQNIQYLIGGIIVVEYLFSFPGVGKELVEAVAIRDVREVQSLAVFIAAFYIVVNIVADLVVVFLVPRLRTQP
jgi:peptide/nickel transport system permease protein